MLNLYFSTRLPRQLLSLIVLLFAFSAQGRLKQFVYLTLASTFHLTAIPFFALYLLVKRGPVGWLIRIALAIGLRIFFLQLLAAFDVVPAAMAEKLGAGSSCCGSFHCWACQPAGSSLREIKTLARRALDRAFGPLCPASKTMPLNDAKFSSSHGL